MSSHLSATTQCKSEGGDADGEHSNQITLVHWGHDPDEIDVGEADIDEALSGAAESSDVDVDRKLTYEDACEPLEVCDRIASADVMQTKDAREATQTKPKRRTKPAPVNEDWPVSLL